MIVRWQPRVFVSSSIRGLESVRRRIEEAIIATGIADSWLFEFSATSAGSGPASQYLQAARDSDVFVLIVGDAVRAPTRDEYQVAFEDNPWKVMPFFVGSGTPGTAALRSQLAARHAYVVVQSAEELSDVIAKAMRRFVQSGDIVRPALMSQVAAARTERRTGLGIPEGFEWGRRLAAPHDDVPIDSMLGIELRGYIVGDAGAGKSDAALSALAGAARMDPPRLPLLLRAADDRVELEELAADSLSRVRLNAGDALVRQLLTDGRMAVVVDGLDEIDQDRADVLEQSIIAAAARYPRTPMLVVRRVIDRQLASPWQRFELSELTSTDVDAVFKAFGYEEAHVSYQLPSDIWGLVRLPFWACLIAQFGRAADSGLALLHSLVEARIRQGRQRNPVHQELLYQAARRLALAIQPHAEIRLEVALDIVAAWLEQEPANRRFKSRTSQSVVEDASEAGLLIVEGDRLRFLHPLVADFLAAQGSLETERQPQLTSPDFASMAAVLLPEDREDEAVDLLAKGGIFVLAKALRLRGRSTRFPTGDDVARFDRAYHTLSERVLGQTPKGAWYHWTSGNYHCLRFGPPSIAAPAAYETLEAWGATTSTAEYYCWTQDPFAEFTPSSLAAHLILDAFKQRLLTLDPRTAEYAPPGAISSALRPLTAATKARVIAHVQAQGRARRRFLGAVGLVGSPLDTTVGEPVVALYEDSHGEWYSTSWGHNAADVQVRADEPERASMLTELLADAEAVAYRHLISDIERRLGSRITTQSVRHPSAFDWAI